MLATADPSRDEGKEGRRGTGTRLESTSVGHGCDTAASVGSAQARRPESRNYHHDYNNDYNKKPQPPVIGTSPLPLAQHNAASVRAKARGPESRDKARHNAVSVRAEARGPEPRYDDATRRCKDERLTAVRGKNTKSVKGKTTAYAYNTTAHLPTRTPPKKTKTALPGEAAFDCADALPLQQAQAPDRRSSSATCIQMH